MQAGLAAVRPPRRPVSLVQLRSMPWGIAACSCPCGLSRQEARATIAATASLDQEGFSRDSALAFVELGEDRRRGHGPLQPPLPVLHARGGVRLAPAGRPAHLRGDPAVVEVFTELGVDKVRLTGGEPLLRRDLPDLVRMLARSRRQRPRDDDQRRPARRSGGGAPGGRAPPRHGEPGHAPPRALPRAHAAGRPRRGAARDRGGPGAGLPGSQARHRW